MPRKSELQVSVCNTYRLINAWNITSFSQDTSVTVGSREARTARAVPAPGPAPRAVPTYHVPEAHSRAVRVILYQRVVVGGEQRPTPDLLCKFSHNRTRYCCPIKSSRASAWRRNRKAKTQAMHSLLCIKLCCLFFSLLALWETDKQRCTVRVTSIRVKWPEYLPYNNHPVFCTAEKDISAPLWPATGLLEVCCTMQRKAGKLS